MQACCFRFYFIFVTVIIHVKMVVAFVHGHKPASPSRVSASCSMSVHMLFFWSFPPTTSMQILISDTQRKGKGRRLGGQTEEENTNGSLLRLNFGS